jgi:KDO2-lipid IV(A) lauroyltransferase
LAAVAYYFMYNRRALAVKNILLVGVAKTRKEANRIAKASFQSFAMLTVESIYLSRRVTPENLEQYLTLDAHDESLKLMHDDQKGLIAVSGHVGNWEAVGSAISFHKPVVAITRRMDNPLVQRLMERRNPRHHLTVVDKNSQDRQSLLRSLKGGQALAIMIDQYNKDNGIDSPFMGVVTKTVTSPARLHFATRCPIMLIVGIRVGRLKFKAIAKDPPLMYVFTGDREKDIQRITDDLNERLKKYIREYPEQYLWAHRRWR